MSMREIGAFSFGFVVGWAAYYVNRYRTGSTQISDLASFVAAIGGAAVLAIFPAGGDLFAYYGLGLAIGFLAYFVVLVVMVRKARFPAAFFLDGRVSKLGENEERAGPEQRPMFIPPRERP